MMSANMLRVVTAVPRRMKGHAISGLSLDPPTLSLLFRSARNESKFDAVSLNGERGNLDVAVFLVADFIETFEEDLFLYFGVSCAARPKIVDNCVFKFAVGTKEIECIVRGRPERMESS